MAGLVLPRRCRLDMARSEFVVEIVWFAVVMFLAGALVARLEAAPNNLHDDQEVGASPTTQTRVLSGQISTDVGQFGQARRQVSDSGQTWPPPDSGQIRVIRAE